MDQEAVNKLVSMYMEHAQYVAAKFGNIPALPPDELESIAARALVEAAQGFLDKKGNFAAYSTAVIRCRIIDELRVVTKYKTRYVLVDPSDQTLDASSPNNPVEDAVSQKESHDALEEILSRIPENQREVLKRWADGESFAEIGQTLGISKQMVGKISGKARSAVRDAIEDSEYKYKDGCLYSQSIESSERAIEAEALFWLEELLDERENFRQRQERFFQ